MGVLSSLLASSPCMASEANCERTVRASKRQSRVGGSLKNFHFCFAQRKLNTIGWKMSHRQVILIDDIPGWPAVNVCCIHLKEKTWSLSPSVIGERFLRTIWLYFLPFSLDLNLADYINRQIRILRSGCQENIVILNLTAFVVFKSLPKTKSVDMTISKRMRGQSGK